MGWVLNQDFSENSGHEGVDEEVDGGVGNHQELGNVTAQ